MNLQRLMQMLQSKGMTPGDLRSRLTARRGNGAVPIRSRTAYPMRPVPTADDTGFGSVVSGGLSSLGGGLVTTPGYSPTGGASVRPTPTLSYRPGGMSMPTNAFDAGPTANRGFLQGFSGR